MSDSSLQKPEVQMPAPKHSGQEGHPISRPYSPPSNAPPAFPVPTHSRGPSGSSSPPPSFPNTQGQGRGFHSAGRSSVGSIQQSYLSSNEPSGPQNASAPPPYAPYVQPAPQDIQPRPHGAMRPTPGGSLPMRNLHGGFDGTFAHDYEAGVGNDVDVESVRKERFGGPRTLDTCVCCSLLCEALICCFACCG